MPAVDGVVREERTDLLAVVASPGIGVAIQPARESGQVGHRSSLARATSVAVKSREN
jgi:hypothetical protein